MDDTPLSAHPVDRLMREIAASQFAVTDSDIDQIIERIATAPFYPREIVVPQDLRGGEYLGVILGRTVLSVTLHLIKRIAIESQWRANTTAEMFVNDLRQVVRHRSMQLGVYRRRGGAMVIGITETSNIVPAERRGSQSLPLIVVVYSADRGMIVSGYQASAWETIAVPGDTKWLR